MTSEKETGDARVITKIVPSLRAPGVRSVRVGGKLAGAISEKGAELLGLTVGAAWTAELEQAFDRRVAYEKARRAAVRWLNQRPMTRAAVEKRLTRYTLSPREITELADELQASGLIDDGAFASAAAASRVQRGPIAREGLVAALGRRGIDGDDAERAADEALDGHDPLADAKSLAMKRARTILRGTSEPTVRRRLYEYLARRGFDEDACEQAVEHVLKERATEPD